MCAILKKKTLGYELFTESQIEDCEVATRSSINFRKPQGIDAEYPSDLSNVGEKGPDIFQIITSFCQHQEVNLNIPETLISSPDLKSPIFLYTNDLGMVKIYSKAK